MDGTLKLWDATTMSEALAFEEFADGPVEGDGKIFHHAMSPIAAHGVRTGSHRAVAVAGVGCRWRKTELVLWWWCDLVPPAASCRVHA